jgi:DtxR family transcriptional regulator, Mn-dependent transcriptional regulator
MTANEPLSTTMEDYLEAIAWLVGKGGHARARDIAAALAVHKSTVTAALRALAEKGLVNYAAYEHATLTPAGRRIADEVIRRHEIVRGFFIQVLALDHEVADANACRMEHILDAEVLDRLASFAEFVKNCPSAAQQCLKQFQPFYERCSQRTEAEMAKGTDATPSKKRKAADGAHRRKRSPPGG